MFAGIFGKRRYRMERRDKRLVKRAAQRYSLKTVMAQQTVRVVRTVNGARRQLQRARRPALYHNRQRLQRNAR